MNDYYKECILEATGAESLFQIELIQQLWSGYGQILRYGLKGSDRTSIVAKHVRLPKGGTHPRGWNTDLSHERKVRSYEIETRWYDNWSRNCDDACHVPECLAFRAHEDEVLIVLEDLDASGYCERRSSVSIEEMKACLKWLANFHATFLNEKPEGLWDVGTYWHLDTRPEELAVLADVELKSAARAIDEKLRNSPFQTFVHGDAKLANFCFSADGKRVAAVDFQYVGGGCGMKDVAYFIGSCLYEDDCEKYEAELLDFYFQYLSEAVSQKKKDVDVAMLEADWRSLYPVAWTDFHRFIKGWSPGHWKINSYSERLSREVLKAL